MRSPCGPKSASSSTTSRPAEPSACGTRVSNSAASPGPTRTELLVVREDGVWRVPVESGGARRVPGTRGAVAAAWAPSGRELAFEREGAVHAVNTDGTGARMLVRGSDPSWSADGRWLAFVRDGRIVVARRNGTAA